MKTEELRIWLRSANITRKEFAGKIGISSRTIDNWFVKGAVPSRHIDLINYMMRETMGKLSFSLTAVEMSKLMKKMTAAGYTDLNEYITHLIRRELGGK